MHESGITKSYFYEDLGIYRLLLLIENNGYLETYVQDYLSPVFDYDQKMDSNSLKHFVFISNAADRKKRLRNVFSSSDKHYTIDLKSWNYFLEKILWRHLSV